jgi:hypothetical protein
MIDRPMNSTVTSEEAAQYRREGQALWEKFVPSSGQADTVQGELIRCVGRLWDETARNGNMNWDEGHVLFAEFLRNTLVSSGLFDAQTVLEIEADVDRVLNFEEPAPAEPFERLERRVVDWARAHPEPVPHQHNPLQYR